MNGSSLVLDTNAFIYFFEGNKNIAEIISITPVIYFSSITEIELLSYNKLNKATTLKIIDFLSQCYEIKIDKKVVELSIKLRKQYLLKIPDTIIAASAISVNTSLVSKDKIFDKISELELIANI